MADEIVPAYAALIRHELGLAPGGDAVETLARRLAPEAASERPPNRAPGIIRLRHALEALRAGRAPDASLEEFTTDLRFLALFAPDATLDEEGLDRLLDDVRAAPDAGVPGPKARLRRAGDA